MQSLPNGKIDEDIKQFITLDESLYDLMCSLIGFEITTENNEFNSTMLGNELTQGSSLEITYCSNNEKNPFLYFFLTEILYLNYKNTFEAGPIIEIVLFDNFNNLNIINLHLILAQKLGDLGDQNKRDEIIKDLLKKLYIYRPYTKKDFLLNLKAVGTVIDKNKFLKVVIIDSINSFQFFEDTHRKGDFDMGKDKKRMSINVKKNFYKEVNARIQENIQKLVNMEKLCTILFKREYFKMQDSIAWDETRSKFCINPRLSGHLNNRIFTTRKICLINFENINDSTVDILNKMTRTDKKHIMIDRQPNLNLAIIRPDSQTQTQNLVMTTYSFTELYFQVLNWFQIGADDYFFTNRENFHHVNG